MQKKPQARQRNEPHRRQSEDKTVADVCSVDMLAVDGRENSAGAKPPTEHLPVQSAIYVYIAVYMERPRLSPENTG